MPSLLDRIRRRSKGNAKSDNTEDGHTRMMSQSTPALTSSSGKGASRGAAAAEEWAYRPAPAPPSKADVERPLPAIPGASEKQGDKPVEEGNVVADRSHTSRATMDDQDEDLADSAHGRRSVDRRSRAANIPSDIPSRTTSLHQAEQIGDLTSGGDVSGTMEGMEKLSVSGTGQDGEGNVQTSGVGAGEDTQMMKELQKERSDLANRIAAEARGRRTEVSDDGKEVFRKAGLGEKLGMRGEVEVRTEWMKPVVQETIRVQEHTEITEIIDREVHKHHIFPKIQPISDPDPIMLETLHRIFNADTGNWHEVTGDAAAIAILGEDVFHNGKRELRTVRRLALPGLGGEIGGETRSSSFVGYDDDAMGPPRQFDKNKYKSRVIEREGTGGLMGSWKALGASGGNDGKDSKDDDQDQAYMIGEVNDKMGEKTMGVAI